ncbi:MAG TPA: very short patch repair endonuclease [Candidatus Paceibacterota bacterium]
MADVFSKKKRSEIMALIRSKNTKPEIALRKLVSATAYPLGYRYQLHYKKLPGKPDIVFVSKKVAVFVDGSFWHGHRLKNGQALPRKYWLPKIKRNMERDKEVNLELKKMGWKVIRVWEHDLKKNQKKTLDTIMRILNR